MRGTNFIFVNRETVLQALQEYFDKHWYDRKGEITDFEIDIDSGSLNNFKITVVEKNPEPKS